MKIFLWPLDFIYFDWWFIKLAYINFMLFWTRIYLQKWYRLFVFICICDIPLCRVPLPDHKCPLVVLFLQATRVHWHLFLHTAEKQSPNHISPRLPPRQHAEHLVVRHELDTLRSLWVFYSDSHSNASRTLCFVLFFTIWPLNRAK